RLCLRPSPLVSFFLLAFRSPPLRPALHSFPTRRSSDLLHIGVPLLEAEEVRFSELVQPQLGLGFQDAGPLARRDQQRKDSCQGRSEEHTSELQSHLNLVCRLLLEKKKKNTKTKTQSRLY